MNQDATDGSSGATPNADTVAQYLRANPDFFNHYPELLRSLELPHVTGQAVSLWERQLAVVREDYQELKGRFDALLTSARSNEDLIGRIHRLALGLMDAAGPRAVFSLLTQRLAEDFHAERVTILVFADPAFVDGNDLPQFVGRDSSRRVSFAPLFNQRDALCGRLTLAQTQALCDDAGFAGSHVVLPIVRAQWDGLLAISSRDPHRFDAGQGTEFLSFLRDVLGLVLEPWVAKPRTS